MVKVNYIRECRAFTAIAAEERFTANEVVLWHALFELFNRKAESDNWPDGFIQISNARLLALTTFGCGDSGCETLRKARERLQARGLIKYRKGRRKALTPEYCLCYFYADKNEPAGSVKTPVPISLRGTIQGRRTGKLMGKPLGRPLGKPLRKPLGKSLGIPLGIPLDIPLNVNVNPNVNPDQVQTHFSTGRGNPPRAGQSRARPVGDAASCQHNIASRIPAEQGVERGYDYEELRGQTSPSGYDLGWKTSARARGAVAQRLLDKYDGQLDTKDAWGDLCEVMADGLDPGTIEQALPTRPCFSLLIARLRALALCRGCESPKRGSQGAPRAGPGP